jgi:hypothetical protein
MGDVDYQTVSADSHVIEPHDLWPRLYQLRAI